MTAVATGTLLWLSPINATADTVGSVRGYIRSPWDDQSPLSGADIIIRGAAGTWRARTNARGFFVVWGLPPGRYGVAATHDEYLPASRVICVHADEDQYADLRLHPSGWDIGASYMYFQELIRFRPDPSQTTDLYSIGEC